MGLKSFVLDKAYFFNSQGDIDGELMDLDSDSNSETSDQDARNSDLDDDDDNSRSLRNKYLLLLHLLVCEKIFISALLSR